MNGTIARGQMKQLRGMFRTGLCRLTGDDLGRMSGRMLRLVGKAQVKYGRARAAAGKQMRKITRH